MPVPVCQMLWPTELRSEQETEANARRIVACVNACAGFSTETLELLAAIGGMQNKMVATYTVAKQKDQLLAFANDILDSWPDGGSLDGGDIQEYAVKHGLLRPTVVHEPCNSDDPDQSCRCAEYCMPDEFSEGVMCYRRADALKGGAA